MHKQSIAPIVKAMYVVVALVMANCVGLWWPEQPTFRNDGSASFGWPMHYLVVERATRVTSILPIWQIADTYTYAARFHGIRLTVNLAALALLGLATYAISRLANDCRQSPDESWLKSPAVAGLTFGGINAVFPLLEQGEFRTVLAPYTATIVVTGAAVVLFTSASLRSGHRWFTFSLHAMLLLVAGIAVAAVAWKEEQGQLGKLSFPPLLGVMAAVFVVASQLRWSNELLRGAIRLARGGQPRGARTAAVMGVLPLLLWCLIVILQIVNNPIDFGPSVPPYLRLFLSLWFPLGPILLLAYAPVGIAFAAAPDEGPRNAWIERAMLVVITLSFLLVLLGEGPKLFWNRHLQDDIPAFFFALQMWVIGWLMYLHGMKTN